jgi:hypothetical protein
VWHNIAMNSSATSSTPSRNNRSLRDQVDELLPDWQSWYPSLFDAAYDLGILRARVCDLSTLVLSKRHASVYNEAVQSFREQWSVEEPEESNHSDFDTHHGDSEEPSSERPAAD